MYSHILRISQIIKNLVTHFPVNRNPIQLRIEPLLGEMNWSVTHIIDLFRNEPLNKDMLKYFLSILYRDDDAVDPLLRAWERASIWMESADPDVIKRQKELYQSFKQELQEMVPDIESLFGRKEMRTIVTPLYR